LHVLQQVQLFMPLSAPVIERLADVATDATFLPGEVLIREGDIAGTFFVLESGEVEISIAGAVVGRQGGLGASFGEIALLRNVPRSASVTAVEPVAAVVLDRDSFLDALTRQGRSRRLAETVADERWRAAH
jgi:CRP-like cAMP-binding protein